MFSFIMKRYGRIFSYESMMILVTLFCTFISANGLDLNNNNSNYTGMLMNKVCKLGDYCPESMFDHCSATASSDPVTGICHCESGLFPVDEYNCDYVFCEKNNDCTRVNDNFLCNGREVCKCFGSVRCFCMKTCCIEKLSNNSAQQANHEESMLCSKSREFEKENEFDEHLMDESDFRKFKKTNIYKNDLRVQSPSFS